MLVTLRFQKNDVLYCTDPSELTYKIENDELAIYRNDEFLGYYASIVGMDESEFIKLVEEKLNTIK